jgi:S-adenosylmethionine hydrolase
VLRLAPHTQLVDLSHEVPAGDVEAPPTCWPRRRAFPAGTVHLAVVDPGVGSPAPAGGPPRRPPVRRPDNGLLTPQLVAGGEAWAVTRRDLFLDGPDAGGGRGVTFHGRDRFAPIAAALLRGEPAALLGERIDDAVRAWPCRHRGGAGRRELAPARARHPRRPLRQPGDEHPG